MPTTILAAVTGFIFGTVFGFVMGVVIYLGNGSNE